MLRVSLFDARCVAVREHVCRTTVPNGPLQHRRVDGSLLHGPRRPRTWRRNTLGSASGMFKDVGVCMANLQKGKRGTLSLYSCQPAKDCVEEASRRGTRSRLHQICALPAICTYTDLSQSRSPGMPGSWMHERELLKTQYWSDQWP